MASSKVPQRLTLESLTEEAENSWSAELTWSFPHAMNDTSRSFLILYHCEGLEPQTITSDECTTVIKDLRPDTKYTANVCTVFQDDKKSANTSITFYTRELRIVLLGKTGTGKSSTGNTILGEEAFGIGTSVASETAICTAKSKIVRGRKIKIVDTPGMFDTDTPEEYLIPEITACITECSPGPHAFIILLKAEKYTQQEKDVLEKLKNLFEGDALKNAVLLFTQGDILREAQTIQDFLKGKENLDQGQRGKDVSHKGSPKCHLNDLVDACGGRCHVIDNKYWNQEHEYRSNSIQVERLLNTIEEIVACTIDSGGYYTNDFLKYVEENIKEEMLKIWSKEKTLCRTKVRQQARKTVEKQILSNRVAGLTSGILIGALCGPFTAMGLFFGLAVGKATSVKSARGATTSGETTKTGNVDLCMAAGVVALETVATGIGSGLVTGAVIGTYAVSGAIVGGITGADKIQAAKAKSIGEATWQTSKQTFQKNINFVKSTYKHMAGKEDESN